MIWGAVILLTAAILIAVCIDAQAPVPRRLDLRGRPPRAVTPEPTRPSGDGRRPRSPGTADRCYSPGAPGAVRAAARRRPAVPPGQGSPAGAATRRRTPRYPPGAARPARWP